jgi:hypothetical protein
MQYEVQTPLRGYNGTVAGVTFAGGRATVDADQHAALSYFSRHHYVITPIRSEPADSDDPGDGGQQPPGPPGETTGTADPNRQEPPEPEAEHGDGTAAEPTGETRAEGQPLARPGKNAAVATWAAYTAQLLGVTVDELGGKTKNELQQLVAEHEQKGADQ